MPLPLLLPLPPAGLPGLGAASRLIDTLARVVEQVAAAAPAAPATPGSYDMDTAILLVICKAISNICAEDVAVAGAASSSSSVTEEACGAAAACLSVEERDTLFDILECVEAAEALVQHSEVQMVAGRLQRQLASMQ